MQNWSEMAKPGKRAVLLITSAMADVAIALIERYTKTTYFAAISHAAHLGGAIHGFLVGIIVIKNIRVRQWERVIWWMAYVSYILLLCSSVAVIVAP